VRPIRLVSLVGILAMMVPFCWAQQNSSAPQQLSMSAENPVHVVARSTKAIDYREGSKSEIAFQGTDLSPEVAGKAEVQTKGTTSQIKVEVDHLRPANTFGLQYLTYVLWAISPEGVPSNLGELDVKDGKGEIRASTPMQAFALVVSAEPYFAVSQPSEQIVAVNNPGPNAQGWTRAIDVSYKALPGSVYASQTEPIQEPVYGIDKNVPTSLKEARNAVRIAKLAHADQYASDALQRAQQLLSQADDYYHRKQNEKAIATVANEATQAAEAARLSAVKGEQQARYEQEQQRAMQAAARAQAQAEAQARQAQQADAARRAAEQQAAQAQAAAQQAAAAAQTAQQQLQQAVNSGQQVQAQQQSDAQQAQAQAERARQEAAAAQQRAQQQEQLAQQAQQQLQQQQTAAQQAQQQLQAEQAAHRQAQQTAEQAQQQLQQTQQQLQQAQADKEQVRQRLLGQLNQVLETKDTAQGLIVNMPDVLFNLNSASLKPEARERLAKVAGILIAYPDIHVEVDGYTDNTGTASYNQQLSEQRAQNVREYLVQQGVPSGSVISKGFGQNNPIASNDSPDGRRQNRRVSLLVSGQSIGAQAIPPQGPQ